MVESSVPNAGAPRALLALIIVVVPVAAMVVLAPRIDAGLARIAGDASGSVGYWLDAVIAVLILLQAISVSLILRQRIVAGGRAPGLILSSLPVGVVAVTVAIGMAAAANAVAVIGSGEQGFLLLMTGTLLIGAKAVGEEALFRGVLQPLLCRTWGVAAGIALTAIAFTAIHVAGGWRDPVSLLNITLAGGWFGLLAWRTGGILAPTLAHGGYNWAEEMLFGASPNPGLGDFGALLNLDLTGPAMLGGSADGLNASLLLTSVLLAVSLPLIIRGSANGNHESNGAKLSR